MFHFVCNFDFFIEINLGFWNVCLPGECLSTNILLNMYVTEPCMCLQFCCIDYTQSCIMLLCTCFCFLEKHFQHIHVITASLVFWWWSLIQLTGALSFHSHIQMEPNRRADCDHVSIWQLICVLKCLALVSSFANVTVIYFARLYYCSLFALFPLHFRFNS